MRAERRYGEGLPLSKEGFSHEMKKFHSTIVATGTHTLPPIMMLRAFERVASRLSFRLAAQDLSLTPSAVSHQMRGLEHYFGVRLFARTGRAVRLTPTGEQYLGSVRSALAILERASRALSLDGPKGREIRVSALPFFASTVMLPRLDRFVSKFPYVTVRIEATPQYADFEGTAVDIAVRMGRERSAGLHCDRLLDVTAVPVCAPNLSSREPRLESPSDLTHHTLLQISMQPNAWQSWLQDAGLPRLEPAGEIWFDNVSLALEAAERGLGVALAMDPLIRARPGFGLTLVTPLPTSASTTRTYYAVCRPEQKDERVVSAFRRWLIQSTRDAASKP
jgi:LysR family glycine cleavage system transcriptional activator